MPNPYSVALRKRSVMAYERGAGSYAQLAALFEVDHRTLERWVPRWRTARWRTARSVEPRPCGRLAFADRSEGAAGPRPRGAGGTVKFSGRVADLADEERHAELPRIPLRRSLEQRARPPEIISHAVWLYHRFGVSFRDVEDLLAQRGITVSYEAIRLWCLTLAFLHES